MKQKFELNHIYKFGVLSRQAEKDLDNYFPVFATKPSAVSISGSQLREAGIESFDQYLKLNPHNFPINKTVHCYDVTDTEKFIKVAEGNPLPKSMNYLAKGEQGLADGSEHPLAAQLLGKQHINNSKQNNKFVDETMRDLRNQIKILQGNNSELINRQIELEREKAEIEAEKHKLQIEYDFLKGKTEEMMEGKNQPGLADNVMRIGSQLLSDPEARSQATEALKQGAGFIADYLRELRNRRNPQPPANPAQINEDLKNIQGNPFND